MKNIYVLKSLFTLCYCEPKFWVLCSPKKTCHADEVASSTRDAGVHVRGE